MRTMFLAATLLLAAACASPFVARVQFDGRGAAAFDGDLFAEVHDGTVAAEVGAKGSDAPMYAYEKTEGGAALVSTEGDWKEEFDLGTQLPADKLVLFDSLFSPAQMKLLAELMKPPPP